MGKMSPFLGCFWGETAPQRGPFSTQIWVALGSWWIHTIQGFQTPSLPVTSWMLKQGWSRRKNKNP